MKTANDFSAVWDRAFQTPMMEAAYMWAGAIISSGHTGGVLYAPTRTGKTMTVKLLTDALRSFEGPRGEVTSQTLSMVARDRLVTAEGPFWEWILQEVGHYQSGRKLTPMQKRHCVTEFMKDLAEKAPSGRVVVFIDEAQFLERQELGWLADLFNSMQKDGFKMVLFLVGSYLLEKWQDDLRGQPQEHVRSRFFANEHRLRGLSDVSDFRACLRNYDTEAFKPGWGTTITEAFLPEWFEQGGRMENLATTLRDAFREVGVWGKDFPFDVPMMYFCAVVRRLLDYREQESDPEKLKMIVRSTGFERWCEGRAKQ